MFVIMNDNIRNIVKDSAALIKRFGECKIQTFLFNVYETVTLFNQKEKKSLIKFQTYLHHIWCL